MTLDLYNQDIQYAEKNLEKNQAPEPQIKTLKENKCENLEEDAYDREIQDIAITQENQHKNLTVDFYVRENQEFECQENKCENLEEDSSDRESRDIAITQENQQKNVEVDVYVRENQEFECQENKCENREEDSSDRESRDIAITQENQQKNVEVNVYVRENQEFECQETQCENLEEESRNRESRNIEITEEKQKHLRLRSRKVVQHESKEELGGCSDISSEHDDSCEDEDYYDIVSDSQPETDSDFDDNVTSTLKQKVKTRFPLLSKEVPHGEDKEIVPNRKQRKARVQSAEESDSETESVVVDIRTSLESNSSHGTVAAFLGQNESDSEDEDIPPEDEISRDISNNDIFVKLVCDSPLTKGLKVKKTKRKYDSYHYCPFCKYGKIKYSNPAQHLTRVHKNEDEVKILMQLGNSEEDTKDRKKRLDLFRFRGDHLHNLKVIKRGKGEIILGRRFRDIHFDLSKTGPCPKCFRWMTLKLLGKHRCPEMISSETPRTLITRSMVMCGRISPQASQSLQKEVYTVMLHDEVGMVCRQDPLIISVGNLWMQRNAGNQLMRASYTSAIMRLCSNMLIILRRSSSVPKVAPKDHGLSTKNAFWDYLRPQHFDLLVQAALITSTKDMDDTEELKSPSNAIKIGYEIKRLINIKLGLAIRLRDNDIKGECRDLLELFANEWGQKVTKLARITLAERQLTIEQQLPHPDDLVKLSRYLEDQLSIFDTSVKSDINFKLAVQLTQAKLISFNRRRAGEIQALRLVVYLIIFGL